MTATSKHDTDLEAEPQEPAADPETAANPAAAEPATEPAAARPAAAEPDAAETGAAEPAAEPAAVDPAAAEPAAAKRAAAKRAAGKSGAAAKSAAEATAAEPITVEPAAVKRATAKSGAAAKSAAETSAAEPTAVELAAVEPVTESPADAEPAATADPGAGDTQGAAGDGDGDGDGAELSEVSDSVEIGGPPAGRKDHSSGERRRRPRFAVVALAVAVALVAAGGVFAWLQINELRDRAAAPEQARQAAVRFAADLGTYDYRDPAGNFRLVAEQSTDNFSGQLKQITEAMTPLLQQTKATSKGSVAAAGVSSADEHRAVVVLFLDQTIENTNTKQPRVDRSRMQLTLVNADGVWKLDHVEAR